MNNPPDNDVDDEDSQTDGKILTTLVKTSTQSSSDGPRAPYWSNLNAMSKYVLRPSGNMIRMKCPAKGDPEPKWEWTKNGDPIERNLGTVVKNKIGNTITLEDLVPADNGNYTCKVCNSISCINYTTILEVNGKNFNHSRGRKLENFFPTFKISLTKAQTKFIKIL